MGAKTAFEEALTGMSLTVFLQIFGSLRERLRSAFHQVFGGFELKKSKGAAVCCRRVFGSFEKKVPNLEEDERKWWSAASEWRSLNGFTIPARQRLIDRIPINPQRKTERKQQAGKWRSRNFVVSSRCMKKGKPHPNGWYKASSIILRVTI